MYLKTVLFCLALQINQIENANHTGVKYYFKLDRPLTDFKVVRKIHRDYNTTVLDYKMPENLQRIAKEKLESEPAYTELFLDEEWIYNKTDMDDSSELPTFFEKFYETRSKKLHHVNYTTTRFLFNQNANTSSSIIQFNLDSVKENETITEADLFFYWPLDNSSDIYKTSVVLRLYQFEHGKELNENTLLDNPDVHKVLNVIYIAKAQKGWQNFKVKKAFNNWLSGEENLGLLLTISTYGENKLISIFNDTNLGKFRTFAVIHVMENGTSLQPEISPEQLESLTKPDHTSIVHYTNQCQRKSWFVDFKRLDWNDFIIFPDGYTAFDCYGKCTVKDNESIINHIKLLHFFKQRISYCVPTNYLPLPIMYYDEFGNVALKNYDNMVATECGCR